ncbi:hypothetical protein F2Q70_00045367 [Brassica cretica]|uniref:Uncharacterized protein n=1 Tax=Brassica cretica TaxID=69181 RepID=A0A8S9KFR6_BRACR|nr:hypothetical protein F2Q70_00045367 [Brassica cretica]
MGLGSMLLLRGGVRRRDWSLVFSLRGGLILVRITESWRRMNGSRLGSILEGRLRDERGVWTFLVLVVLIGGRRMKSGGYRRSPAFASSEK